jgi:hypothetical protein
LICRRSGGLLTLTIHKVQAHDTFSASRTSSSRFRFEGADTNVIAFENAVTHSLVGMRKASRLAQLESDAEASWVGALRDRRKAGLVKPDEIYVRGNLERRIPHTLNASSKYAEGESLIIWTKGVAFQATNLHISVARAIMGASGAWTRRRACPQFDRVRAEPHGPTATTKASAKWFGRKPRQCRNWARAPCVWVVSQENIDFSTIQRATY